MGNTFLKQGFLILAVIVCTFILSKPSSFAQTSSVAVNRNNIRSGIMHGPVGPFKTLEDARRYLKNQGMQMSQNSSQASMNTLTINPNAISAQPSVNTGASVPPACCSGTPWNYLTELGLGVLSNGVDTVEEAGYVEYMGSPGEGAHPYNSIWTPYYTMGQSIPLGEYTMYWWASSNETINANNNIVAFYATINSSICTPESCYYPPLFFAVSYVVPSISGWFVDYYFFSSGYSGPKITYYLSVSDGCGLKDIDIDRDGWTTCDGDCNDFDASINPGATEVCDGIDNNCNGLVDENTYLNVPYLNQGDSQPWANDPYNSTGDLMRDGGCALTAFNMVWNYYFPNYSQTPNTINGILNGIPGGYNPGGDFNWDNACDYASGLFSQQKCTEQYAPYDDSTIDSQLCAGHPVIIKVPHHFVVITGKDGIGNYVMNDPGCAGCKNFNSKYPKGGQGLRIIAPVP